MTYGNTFPLLFFNDVGPLELFLAALFLFPTTSCFDRNSQPVAEEPPSAGKLGASFGRVFFAGSPSRLFTGVPPFHLDSFASFRHPLVES